MKDAERIAELTIIVTDLADVVRKLLNVAPLAAKDEIEVARCLSRLDDRIERLSVAPVIGPCAGDDWKGRARSMLDRVSTPSVHSNRLRGKA